MPRLPLFVLAFLGFSSSAMALDVPSRIDAVAVYPSGAMVTRIAAVDLPAGTTTVRLTGLVSGLDPNQLRIETGAGADGVELGQVRFDREQRRSAYNAEIERLGDEIRTVEGRIAAIDDAVKSAELRLRFLDSLAQGYAKEAWHGGASGAADVGSWREALTLLESASGDAYAEIRRRKTERSDAERDLSVLQRELADTRGGSLASMAVEVSLRSSRAQSTELRLHYYQPNAGWAPNYEARLDSDTAQLILTQQADVRQGTDEPWNGVAMTLSTSNPSGTLEPGALDPEFLDLVSPMPRSPARDRVAGLKSANDAAEEITVTGQAYARAQVGNFAVTYEIPGRVTVANDADESQAFDVTTMETAVELLTRVIPRRSEQAYLAARFTYDRTVPLHTSTMRVYVDGAYAGITRMPTALPQSEVTLPMGTDRRVDVTAVDQGEEKGREGLVSRKKTQTTHYLFEITNRRRSDTVVEVLDRYPVARNDDIDVDVPRTATTPTETDVDDKPGVILWRKTVPPGDAWRIRHQYTVSYPADRMLSGN